MTAIDTACARIAPLFPLDHFVAVNPYFGLVGMEFPAAAEYLTTVAPGSLLPGAPPRAARLHTVADWLDRTQNTTWNTVITEELSKWCSSFYDQGQSLWSLPHRERGLYFAWKSAAALDSNPEFQGLAGFRRFVAALPDGQDDALAFLLAQLPLEPALIEAFLHRELMSVHGWSAFAAAHDWGTGAHTHVRALLAVRLAYDVALAAQHPGWHCRLLPTLEEPTLDTLLAAQTVREQTYRDALARRLEDSRPPAPQGRAALQAVFCIDVRSEALRRGLEAQSPAIQTHGFAGFFGLALAVGSTARCPVLLAPSHRVDTATGAANSPAPNVWANLRQSVAAAFPSVETLGVGYAAPLLRSLLGPPEPQPPAQPVLAAHLTLEQKIEWAASVFTNLGLDAERLAPIVLICGHGGQSQNNPYAASLDCGACGGHPGDANARIAAGILNEPAVRRGLAARGLRLPIDTAFVAGFHDTTTDDVTLLDANQVPQDTRAQLEAWLSSASAEARRQRGTNRPAAHRRAADWSEVRPEWGLANNAAFVAAPRWRTSALNLEGRAFLHDYDHTRDTDSAVLTLILTAPVVVASWINLQYYASTVNPGLYGSGTKVLHNVVGKFGVWEGNGGDLRSGLPLESLHDGQQWRHEPLRLQVFIEAPREKIAAVLAAQPGVAQLAGHGWIALHALEDSGAWHWSGPAAGWRKV